MSLKSVLKPDASVTVGLAEAAAVYVIYQSALPSHADLRMGPAHDQNAEDSRKRAAWKAASVLGLVFLITQDVTSFLIGGLALGGIDLMTKHANGVHLGQVERKSDAGPNPVEFPLPDYGDSHNQTDY